jgi:NAD(P)-dependent dehydrogenase (short-subunit alcohol dehydrogenase family)
MSAMTGMDVVVTGGAGALGTAVVRRFLAEGARCVVPSVDDKEVARFPLANDPNVVIVRVTGLTKEDEVGKVYAAAPNLFASIHVAGGFSMDPFVDTRLSDYEKLVNGNGTTAFLCSREAVRLMRAGGRGGRIVNVAAKPALVPSAGVVAYAMSKAMVSALTQSLAEEVKDDRIWVNAIVPSTMDTPANRAAMPGAAFDAWPKVEEVAETVYFLASPANRCTRGALVPVYGRS